MAARSSRSGSPEGSIPSTRGIGSKMMCFCCATLSDSALVNSTVPSSTSSRLFRPMHRGVVGGVACGGNLREHLESYRSFSTALDVLSKW